VDPFDFLLALSDGVRDVLDLQHAEQVLPFFEAACAGVGQVELLDKLLAEMPEVTLGQGCGVHYGICFL